MNALLQNKCSVYYLQTNYNLKSSYFDFSLFLSRLCADKLNKSHLHTEISHNLQLANKSLTYSRNNKGPKIDPWGTPQSIFAIQEYLS